MSIESVMPSSHLILWRPLILLPSIPPSIRVFSNESTLCMRWPKYWNFSFSIIPSKEIPGLISFRMDWLDLLAVQGTLKSLLQDHSSKASILWHSAFFTVQLSHPYMTTGKTIALTRRIFVGKVMSLLLNMLSKLVITFLPRSKCLLISWLQSLSSVILEPRKIKSDTVSTVSPSIYHEVNAKECSNYHTIALISHASKVMLKILQARLQQYVNRELPDVQAGFRKGRGTRDQIANICWIVEKAREFQKNIYFCFIDYAKAFDCVDYNKLWKILKEMGIPDHLICLLRTLYAGQEATVRTGHGTTDWFQIGKGVRQGCILSPWLFNLYAEYIMRNARLEETQAGIKIAGRNINHLRYADDTTLMAESEEELKSLLMKVKVESEKVGLKLNIQKTKIMASGTITSWETNYTLLKNLNK
uniref:Reverse transcriptase domain-containing protein n=1 Tax=Bos indicus x Bos taurus TaxID=30522 RepID=A0A4W2E168_BOBOX